MDDENREAGRLAASRQQHRPVRRAFGLFCATLTCLFLLISTLSAPAPIGATPKALRYGTQKAAGHPSVLSDMECRKRGIAGKVAPLDGSGADLSCLPAETALVLDGGKIVAAVASCFWSGNGRVETRGARAPPLHFA